MKRVVIALLAVLLAVSPVYSLQFSSNELSVKVSGTMPEDASFFFVPTEQMSLDLNYSQGKQVPIATYSFSTNSVKGTVLTVAPAIGDAFYIIDKNSNSYSYQIAICGYDGFGTITSVNQSDSTNTVSINSSPGAWASHGEIYACFPFYDDETSNKLISAGMNIGDSSKADNPAGLYSELFFGLVVV
jgi:hypothetical protein